jgi:hypothetical protein
MGGLQKAYLRDYLKAFFKFTNIYGVIFGVP